MSEEQEKSTNIDYLLQEEATCENMSEVMISDNATKIAKIVAEKSDYNTEIILSIFIKLESGYLTEEEKAFFLNFIENENVFLILEKVLNIYFSTIKDKTDNKLHKIFFNDKKEIDTTKILNYIQKKLSKKITHSLAEKNLRNFEYRKGILIADTGIGQQILLKAGNDDKTKRISSSFKSIRRVENGIFELSLIDPYIKLMNIGENDKIVESTNYERIINEKYKEHIIVKKDGKVIFIKFEDGNFVEKASFDGIGFSITNIEGIFISELENGNSQLIEEKNNGNEIKYNLLSRREFTKIGEFNIDNISHVEWIDEKGIKCDWNIKIEDGKVFEEENSFFSFLKKAKNLKWNEIN